jgi:hypothetical protein
MSRFGCYTVSAEVDLDFELSDDDLLEMAQERGLLPTKAGFAGPEDGDDWDRMERDARAAFERRDVVHFDIVLLRMRASAGVVEPPGAPALFDDDAPRSKPAGRH